MDLQSNKSVGAGSRSGRGRQSVVGLAAAVLVAGLAGAAPPAAGAVGPACPEPFPTDDVTRGQNVSGLTVERGTVPEGFTGEVIGRVEDAVLPGLDLVMVRLSSAAIDRVGVWQGMSGSPVYAEDGRLIGAVAYGFSLAPSPVAGVVPGKDMLELLPPGADGRVADPTVELPRALAKRLVEAGDATAKQAAEGLRALRVPVAVSGVGDRVARELEAGLRSPWTQFVGATAGRLAAAPEIPVTAGSNLAATLSYGDVTAMAVGTATAVCGPEVVGFGHPLLGSGWARMGLHGADAVYVQEDLLFPAFKVANIGAPIGAIRQDRLVGVAGTLGAPPQGPVITSTVTRGADSRAGRTDVYDRSVLADVALAHVGANIDRALGLGGGTARARLTITGTLPGGRGFTVRRNDVHTSGSVAFDAAEETARPLERLQGFGQTSVSRVDVTATVDRSTTRAFVKSVSVRQNGRWVAVKRGGSVTLNAGSTAVLRATMQRTSGGAAWSETLQVRVPARAAGSSARLRVVGGGAGFLDQTRNARSASALVAALRSTPGNADVVAHLQLPGWAGGVQQGRADAGLVVSMKNQFAVTARIR